ncbi:MAG: TonB-dependent receptor [Ignavibacteriae bacterium]|nr:TonB-dependent receptor [Ignavibacteriota bacterium]MCB9243311.1 TonB-dependent receptor [Ignavibacteriales bacterium]
MGKNLSILVLLLFLSGAVYAQDNDSPDTTKYKTETIEVYDEYKGINLKETPGSIDIVTEHDFDRNNGIHLMNTINLIPGIKMEMRTATSGTRILMRGYGTQTNFNGYGYKAYLNNIPLTDADGTTTLDDIDFTTIGKMEILKGPFSSLYGMGIGGVINMQTEKAPNGTTLREDFTGGSYGLYRSNTMVEMGTPKTNLFLNYGWQSYESFRIHNKSLKNFMTANGYLYSDPNRKVSIYFNYTNSDDQLAGQVDSIQFINDPDTAEVAYLKNDAHIQIESEKIGVAHDYNFSKVFSNSSSVFVGGFTLDQPFAVGLNRSNKVKFGGRTSFIYKPMLGKIPSRFIFGAEVLRNINYQKSYGYVNQQITGTRSDLEVKPMVYFAFLQTEFNFTPNTQLVAGASVNFVEYDITDNIPQSSTHNNTTGYKSFDPVLTPRIALNQLLSKDVSVYASFSQGYAPPSTNQVVIPEIGQVNTDLVPEKGTSYEIGSKGSFMNQQFNYSIALYYMQVTNKLVPETFSATSTTPMYTTTVNAGEVKYQGVEASIFYDWFGKPRSFFSHIRPYLTYTYNDAENVDFKNNNNNDSTTIDYSGLKVSGVPPHLLNAGLDVETHFGGYFYTSYSYTAEYPIVLDNSHIAEAYGLLNMKLGYKKQLDKNWILNIFAGSDNMTSEKYPAMVFINLSAPPGQLPKFFNPGPKITFYGGASLNYNF